MANNLDISLSSIATTISAAGSSPSVDVGSRRVLSLQLSVIALAEGSLTVKVQTGADGENWRIIYQGNFAASYAQELNVSGAEQFVRLSWEVADGGTFKLGAAGHALELYCSPEDLRQLSLPAGALEEIDDSDLLGWCIAASDIADGHLEAAYTLPLLSWGKDLRNYCLKLVIRDVLDFRGWDPSGADAVYMKAYDDAISWLTKVSRGLVKPAGLRDSTPEVVDSGSVVRSRPRREPFRF